MSAAASSVRASPSPSGARRRTWPCAALLLAALPGAAAAQEYQLLDTFGEDISDIEDLTGFSVAVLGDIDGDGGDELLVGAPWDGDNGYQSGTVYVVGGVPQTIRYEKHGSAPGNKFGHSVANIGDVDGDGVNDFVVGSPGVDSNGENRGSITVFSGKLGLSLYGQLGPKAGSHYGMAVAGGGDINGDGRGDFVVGAPWYDVGSDDAENQGWIGVYSGLAGNSIKTLAGTKETEELGRVVAILGDINGDGRADYAASSPSYDYFLGSQNTDAGRVRAWSGIDHAQLFQKLGTQGQYFGQGLSPAGDTDADGTLELLVGAPGTDGGGSATLYEGGIALFMHHFDPNLLTSDDAFGRDVAPLGDVNHDGHDDVLVGAPLNVAFLPLGGYVQAFSGDGYGPWGAPLASVIDGEQFGDTLSATPGDLDGDGWNDVIIGLGSKDLVGNNSGIVETWTLLHHQPDLGFQGPGVSELSMYGAPLGAGGVADLALLHSKPASPAFLIASPAKLMLPFKGGTLVPSPALGSLFAFATDALGEIRITDVPGGGGPFSVALQFLVKDPAQPKGWQLSNAITAEFLP